MRLYVGCDLHLEASEACAAVAMLRPRNSESQWVANETYRFEPAVRPVEYVDSYGNLCQRFVIPAGSMKIHWSATAETDEHLAVGWDAPAVPIAELPDNALLYLLQSRYCPSDKMVTLAQEVLGRRMSGYQQVETIRRWVRARLTYQYGVSDGTTDALDTLRDGAGVCRDFSHVCISLCRAARIPARMVVGYLYKLDPMDLHAWFEAYVGGRWYAFDATQEEPCGGRIVVAYGRDAADVAFLSNYGPVTTTALKAWVELAEEPAV